MALFGVEQLRERRVGPSDDRDKCRVPYPTLTPSRHSKALPLVCHLGGRGEAR